MSLDTLKQLVSKLKPSFDDCESVYEVDGNLYGSYIERYDDCQPIFHSLDGERVISQSVNGKNVTHQIEEEIRDNGLAAKYAKALDWEGTDLNSGTPQQHCRAAYTILFEDQNVSRYSRYYRDTGN